MMDIEAIWERLKKSGFKITEQRRKIVEIFLELGGHISAEELFHEVRKRKLGIGFATIYRTLNMLSFLGIVAQRNFGDGRVRFEIVSAHHDHLICSECGKIIEFSDDIIERRQEEIAKKFGFRLISHRHELIGICSSCEKKKGKKVN